MRIVVVAPVVGRPHPILIPSSSHLVSSRLIPSHPHPAPSHLASSCLILSNPIAQGILANFTSATVEVTITGEDVSPTATARIIGDCATLLPVVSAALPQILSVLTVDCGRQATARTTPECVPTPQAPGSESYLSPEVVSALSSSFGVAVGGAMLVGGVGSALPLVSSMQVCARLCVVKCR